MCCNFHRFQFYPYIYKFSFFFGLYEDISMLHMDNVHIDVIDQSLINHRFQ